MGFKITNAELDLFFKYAENSVAILFMLIAIRCIEQGGSGREMGILNRVELAGQFQISGSQVKRIVNNQLWRNL